MQVKTKGIAIIATVQASGADAVVIDDANDSNVGKIVMANAAGTNHVPPFRMRDMFEGFKWDAYAAAVAGVYRVKPYMAAKTAVADLTDYRFKTIYQHNIKPNLMDERLDSIKTGSGETATTMVDKIVAAFVGHPVWTVTRSGSGNSSVAVFTETTEFKGKGSQLYLEGPNFETNIHLVDGSDASIGTYSTASTKMVGATGAELSVIEENGFNEIVKTGTYSDSDTFHKVSFVLNPSGGLLYPFDFAHNKPEKYVLYVNTTGSNDADLLTRLTDICKFNTASGGYAKATIENLYRLK